MKQSSKRFLIILATLMLGSLAVWRLSQRPLATATRQLEQFAQTSLSGEEATPRRDSSAASHAAGLPLKKRSALKRDGAPSAPIEFSVIELKSKDPIAGALVSVYEEQGSVPLAEAFADPQGKGRFDATSGRYRIEAVQNGYQKGKTVFSHPSPGASHQTIFLSTAYLMRGKVSNEQGQALAGAHILLKSMNQPEISLQTDEQGSFEISLAPAAYRVEVRKEPYLPKVKPFILVGPRNAPVLEIELRNP